MKSLQRLDTPFKRASLLIMIIGVVSLIVSLVVWTQQSRYHRLYYTKAHYDWVPVGGRYSGKVELFWSLDRACIVPITKSRIAALEGQLAAHRKAEPERPEYSFTDQHTPRHEVKPEHPKDSYESLRAQFRYIEILKKKNSVSKRHRTWSYKKKSLDTQLKKIKENIRTLGYIDIREGQVREGVKKSEAISTFQVGGPQWYNNKTEEEKFQLSLYWDLGLGAFPTHRREKIFKKCAHESTRTYILTRTTHHTKIDNWPKDQPIPFYFSLLLIAAGFLGSFGYKVSSNIIQGTAGRAIKWVRTGNDPVPSAKNTPELHVSEEGKDDQEQA